MTDGAKKGRILIVDDEARRSPCAVGDPVRRGLPGEDGR